MSKNINFYMKLLDIKHKYVKDIGDYPVGSQLCSTVALMKVTGLDFDSTLDLQIQITKDKHVVMNSFRHVTRPLLIQNEYEEIEVPEELMYPGGIGRFMYEHKKDTYVIMSSNHMEYYSNGTRYLALPRPINYTIDLDAFLMQGVEYIFVKK